MRFASIAGTEGKGAATAGDPDIRAKTIFPVRRLPSRPNDLARAEARARPS